MRHGAGMGAAAGGAAGAAGAAVRSIGAALKARAAADASVGVVPLGAPFVDVSPVSAVLAPECSVEVSCCVLCCRVCKQPSLSVAVFATGYHHHASGVAIQVQGSACLCTQHARHSPIPCQGHCRTFGGECPLPSTARGDPPSQAVCLALHRRVWCLTKPAHSCLDGSPLVLPVSSSVCCVMQEAFQSHSSLSTPIQVGA